VEKKLEKYSLFSGQVDDQPEAEPPPLTAVVEVKPAAAVAEHMKQK